MKNVARIARLEAAAGEIAEAGQKSDGGAAAEARWLRRLGEDLAAITDAEVLAINEVRGRAYVPVLPECAARIVKVFHAMAPQVLDGRLSDYWTAKEIVLDALRPEFGTESPYAWAAAKTALNLRSHARHAARLAIVARGGDVLALAEDLEGLTAADLVQAAARDFYSVTPERAAVMLGECHAVAAGVRAGRLVDLPLVFDAIRALPPAALKSLSPKLKALLANRRDAQN